MKKILSLLTVLAMLLTAAAVPATAASPELTSIYGNKGLILAELSESVTPESVKITDTDGNEIKNTYEVKSGSIEIKPEKELKLDKRYVLSIATAEGELEKYITLKTLYKDDFSSDEYTKSNLYSCKWSDTDTWSVKNGRLVRATVLNTYDTQIKKTAENSEWKDYTVEFDYIGSEKTGSYSMDLALNVHFYINGNNATLNNGDGKNYYTTAVNLDTKNKNPIDMGFRASIFGNKTYTKLTNLSTNAVLKENSHTEATGNAKKTSGPFGFSGYHGWSDKGTNVIDNLVCYKLIYSDVEYKADIANNAKDLRNVSEINFDWKIALDSMPKKENIEIADKDGNPYTDFEVSEEGGKTKITFNEELKPENTYTITFSSLTSGGEPVDSITHKFSMGGIYTGVSIEGESVIEAGKETSFKAYAVAESGALCEVPLSSLAFSSSDESVISIDESGDAKANSKGMATVSVVFTDSNTQNPYGTTFEKAINVYSYVDKEDKLKITETSKKIADFKYDNAAVIAEFDDDLSKEFAIILGDLTIKTDGLNYKIGNSEIAREAGKHTFEIVKKDGKFSVYLDGIEALSGFSADNCKAISAGGNLTSVKIYDLQGFPKVESIVGSRGNIIVKFNEEVNVGSVSVFDMNQNEITASFSLNKDKTEVTVTPENPLEF